MHIYDKVYQNGLDYLDYDRVVDIVYGSRVALRVGNKRGTTPIQMVLTSNLFLFIQFKHSCIGNKL